MGFARKVGSGVKSFFYEPYLGMSVHCCFSSVASLFLCMFEIIGYLDIMLDKSSMIYFYPVLSS